ncbi:MAG TPA: hypothetical protein VIK24_14990, partial [Pyrinomonadaceae bacterium]
PEAEPLRFKGHHGKPEAFRTGGGKAADLYCAVLYCAVSIQTFFISTKHQSVRYQNKLTVFLNFKPHDATTK